MGRAIDLDALKKYIKKTDLTAVERGALLQAISNMPTLTPQNEPLTLEQLREMDGQPVYGILRSDAGGLSNQKRMVMFFCKQNRASLDLIRLGALRFTAARRRERHEWQWKRRDADRRVKLQHILPKMRQTRSSDRAWGTGR